MKRWMAVGGVLMLTVVCLLGQDRDERKRDFQLKAAEYLGRLSANAYDPESVENPYGRFGSPYFPTGVRNPYSTAGRAATDPYGNVGSPVIVGEDGTYLGRLNANHYDPESVTNPYGVFGSRYSPGSVNNPYGTYGSRYSPYSATNPYTTQGPKVYLPRRSTPLSTPASESLFLPTRDASEGGFHGLLGKREW